jgi:phage terminase Nu1 subunit (DNA packaging protein)
LEKELIKEREEKELRNREINGLKEEIAKLMGNAENRSTENLDTNR